MSFQFQVRRTSDVNNGSSGAPCIGAAYYGDGWYIRLETLDDLVSLAEMYGDLIVSSESFWSRGPGIEIYDDYRE